MLNVKANFSDITAKDPVVTGCITDNHHNHGTQDNIPQSDSERQNILANALRCKTEDSLCTLPPPPPPQLHQYSCQCSSREYTWIA